MAASTELENSYEDVMLTSPAQVQWHESDEGKNVQSELCHVYQIELLFKTQSHPETCTWQERPGIGDYRSLEWMYEHWHFLRIYNDVLNRVKIEARDIVLAGGDTLSDNGSTPKLHAVQLLNPTVDLNLKSKVENSLVSCCYHGNLQTLRENVRKFLDLTKGNDSVALPAVDSESRQKEVAVVVISSALDYFLDHPECKTTLFVCTPSNKVDILEAYRNVLEKIKLGAESSTQRKTLMTVTFFGGGDAVQKAAKRYKTEMSYAVVTTCWDDSPLMDAIQHLTTEEMMGLESIATKHKTEIYLSKPEKTVKLTGMKDDVEKMKPIIENGLFKCLSQLVTNKHTRVPEFWDPGWSEVTLKILTQEYQKVLAILYTPATRRNFGKLTITKITRVQNEELYAQYQAQKIKVVQSLKDAIDCFPPERDLWYGAKLNAAKQICEDGFSRSFKKRSRLAGTSDDGTAVMFYKDPSQIVNRDFDCLLLTKVLTGRCVRLHYPLDDFNFHSGYHATVDSLFDPKSFAVHHDASAYPQYLVEYTLE